MIIVMMVKPPTGGFLYASKGLRAYAQSNTIRRSAFAFGETTVRLHIEPMRDRGVLLGIEQAFCSKVRYVRESGEPTHRPPRAVYRRDERYKPVPKISLNERVLPTQKAQGGARKNAGHNITRGIKKNNKKKGAEAPSSPTTSARTPQARYARPRRGLYDEYYAERRWR